MRALHRLKGLLRNERGNVVIIGAAALPLLIASAAFAVDTIQLSLMKRQLQRAADSSAIAGAYALGQNEQAPTAVTNDLAKNSFPSLSKAQEVTVGPSHGYQRAVKVKLTAAPKMPLIAFFTGNTTPIEHQATAALVDDGEFCLISLYEGTSAGIDINGNADVLLGCGMKTNSRGDEAVTAGGASNVVARPIAAVGGIDGTKNNFTQPTTLQPYSSKQKDPFAYLPNPSPPANCTTAISVGPNDPPVTIPAGCYSSIDIKGTATFASGEIMVNGGDISFGSQAKVTGTGTTFIMTGPGGAAGDLKINGQASLNLSSPGSGTYKGVLFYRDRRAGNIEIKINGGADSNLTGALYFPSSDITFAGNAGMNVQCLQMVGQILKFRGGANITNTCPASSGASAFKQIVVRLVE